MALGCGTKWLMICQNGVKISWTLPMSRYRPKARINSYQNLLKIQNKKHPYIGVFFGSKVEAYEVKAKILQCCMPLSVSQLYLFLYQV